MRYCIRQTDSKSTIRKEDGFMGSILLIIIAVIIIFLIIPFSCHQEITRKQKIMAVVGVEMSYWDIFFVTPRIIINQGEIVIQKTEE